MVLVNVSCVRPDALPSNSFFAPVDFACACGDAVPLRTIIARHKDVATYFADLLIALDTFKFPLLVLDMAEIFLHFDSIALWAMQEVEYSRQHILHRFR